MAEREATDDATDLVEKQTAFDKCDPNCDAGTAAGPVREGGGTTGAGNLSPGGASRTGGATGGVSPEEPRPDRSRAVPPDA